MTNYDRENADTKHSIRLDLTEDYVDGKGGHYVQQNSREVLAKAGNRGSTSSFAVTRKGGLSIARDEEEYESTADIKNKGL